MLAERRWPLSLFAMLAGCGGAPQTSEAPALGGLPATVAVIGEARVFTGSEGVSTFNPLAKVNAVYSYDDKGARIDYREGSDWVASGDKIARAPGSRIPDFANYRYVPVEGIRFAFSGEPRNPPLTINYNIYIDYSSTAVDRIVRAKPLPKPSRRVMCIGDSIAQGAHTVARLYFNNDSESWCGLLRRRLQGTAGVTNVSVPGATLESLAADISTYLASPADTVILAFGMNDHVRGAEYLPTFARLLDETLSRLAASGTNVLLVGFFQQNSLWVMEDRTQTIAYNEAIRSAARARGVPFIDAYTAFEKAAPVEPVHHLTADFMHHPNVYGQRIYYSLMVPYFLDTDTMASSIEGYVIGDW